MKEHLMRPDVLRHLAVLLLLLPLGCKDGEEALDALSLGEASTAIALDADGCLAEDVSFTSSGGQTLRLPRSCIAFLDGTVVRALTLRLRPQSATTVPLGERGLQSAYRIELLDEQSLPVPASFDSPLEIVVPEPLGVGAWFVTGFVDDNRWSQSAANETNSVTLDAVTWSIAGEGTLRVRQTGVFGVTYEPATDESKSQKQFNTIVTQTVELEGDDSMKLTGFSLVNQQSAFISFASYNPVPAGTTYSLNSQGAALIASYEATGDGGTRLVIISPYSNLWRVTAGQSNAEAATEAATDALMTGGCAEATCPEANYHGLVKSTLSSQGTFQDWLPSFGDFQELFSLPERVILRWAEVDDGLTIGGVDVVRSEASVPRIIERLPEGWLGTGGDRVMTVTTPPPTEITVVVSGAGDGVGNVSSTDATSAISCDVPPLTCTSTYLSREDGEIRLAASAGGDSVFAGWSGCPEPMLDGCILSWDGDDGQVSFDVVANFELIEDDACHSAYSGAPGYLPCAGASAGICKFYVVLNEVRSCDDACADGGGTCVQALRDVADGCSGSEPRACDDPANDRICFCTQPN